jgi:hypothetical protein
MDQAEQTANRRTLTTRTFEGCLALVVVALGLLAYTAVGCTRSAPAPTLTPIPETTATYPPSPSPSPTPGGTPQPTPSPTDQPTPSPTDQPTPSPTEPADSVRPGVPLS